MHNKIYEKAKNFIKDISIILPFSFLLLAITLYPLPFYIYSGGGTIDVDDKMPIVIKAKVALTYVMYQKLKLLSQLIFLLKSYQVGILLLKKMSP